MNDKKTVSFGMALAIIFLPILVILLGGLVLRVGFLVPLMLATITASLLSIMAGFTWKEVEACIVNGVHRIIIVTCILFLVGTLIGVWIQAGVIPLFLYWGLKLLSPSMFLVSTVLICAVFSLMTGTSFGTIGTAGLALLGVGEALGFPTGLTAGAIVSGAYFGDKMSPLSDTTNLASGVSRVPLYDHIGSMMYTTIPAALVALVLFTAAGLMHSGGEMDTTRANLICDTLAEHFNLNPILILPAILVLGRLVSVFKLPPLLGMGRTGVVSIVFAMVFQGVNFVELMNYAANGFTLSTGVDIVDPMLNRGGITSMTGLLITFMVASVMGGIITATGILDVLAKDVLLKFIKSRGVLVTVTLIYCYIVNFLTAGGQTVAIIVTEQTFEDAFDRMGIHRRVLSRTLEDAGTLSAPIVPWGVATLYVMEVLGCGTEYIPYCWFIFIVPIFSILCAFSGFGIWDKDGNKMWGRKKAAAK